MWDGRGAREGEGGAGGDGMATFIDPVIIPRPERLKAASRSPRLDLWSEATASSTSHSSSSPPSRACVATCGQNPRDQPTRSCPPKATPDKPRYAQSDFEWRRWLEDGDCVVDCISGLYESTRTFHVGESRDNCSSHFVLWASRDIVKKSQSIQAAIARRHQIYFASPPIHAFCRRVLREA